MTVIKKALFEVLIVSIVALSILTDFAQYLLLMIERMLKRNET